MDRINSCNRWPIRDGHRNIVHLPSDLHVEMSPRQETRRERSMHGANATSLFDRMLVCKRALLTTTAESILQACRWKLAGFSGIGISRV